MRGLRLKTGARCFMMLGLLAHALLGLAAESRSSGPVPFILDDNRVFVYLTFPRADGRMRQALAFVDLGTPVLVLNQKLARDLPAHRGGPLRFRLGSLEMQVPPQQVQTSNGSFFTGPDGRATVQVEAVLPGSVLKNYEVALDYGKRTLTVARRGALVPQGAAVPCRVNEKTGLIAVDASIGGQTYKFAVDPGSAYSWVSAGIAQDWAKAHPGWKRGRGAVGEANMQTRTGGAEARAIVLRLPEIRIGSLRLKQVGAAGIEMSAPPVPPIPGGAKVEGTFFDWYSKKAPEPVIGWMGGNVLRAFRVTIDFAHHRTYWKQESNIDWHDLDQVGVTLETRDNTSGYFIAGIAEKNGKATVEGVEVGDKLLAIDGVAVANATRGAVFTALHGAPGTIHKLTLERNGKSLSARVPTTRF